MSNWKAEWTWNKNFHGIDTIQYTEKATLLEWVVSVSELMNPATIKGYEEFHFRILDDDGTLDNLR